MYLVFSAASALIGALALTALTIPFHAIFFRPALSDGQYGCVLLMTVPAGTVLGGATGLSLAHLTAGHTLAAGLFALWSGSLLASVSLFLGLFVLCGTEKPDISRRISATIFWFGLPVLWCLLLVGVGLRLIVHH